MSFEKSRNKTKEQVSEVAETLWEKCQLSQKVWVCTKELQSQLSCERKSRARKEGQSRKILKKEQEQNRHV